MDLIENRPLEDNDMALHERRVMDAYAAWWTLYKRGDWMHDAAAHTRLAHARLAYQDALNALDEDVRRAALSEQEKAALGERTRMNMTASHEIVKDASALKVQARWVKAQAAGTRDASRHARRARLCEKSNRRRFDAVLATERAAEVLSTSELRYRRLFEAARDGILILDTDRGRITDANPFMSELLGYSHDELLGKELWEIGLLENQKASQQAFQTLKRSAYIRYENLPLKNRSGERREVEFVCNLYRENGHTVIQCNIRDITERKRHEDALRESEERLRFATEGAGIGVWKLTPETNHLTWTTRCSEIFGLPADGSMNTPGEMPWTLIHPDDVESVRAALARAVQGNTIFRSDYRIVTPQGETRWVQAVGRPYYDATGGVARVEGVLSDISESKRVEADLAAAAAKNERIAETLQRSLLQTLPPGKFSGVEVETLYRAALNEAAVGGDFYDIFALRGGRVALVVGDVSGKGLIAAGRTSEVKYAMRAFLHEYQAPEIALSRLNDFICETHRHEPDSAETLIVAAVAVLNPASGEAVFSAAGAEPSMILRTDGSVEEIETVGWPLGIYTNAEYVSKSLPMARGESILMATDGITEARHGDEFLGNDGIAALAKQAGSALPLSALSRALYDGARAFAGGRLYDDVCLLLARRQ